MIFLDVKPLVTEINAGFGHLSRYTHFVALQFRLITKAENSIILLAYRLSATDMTPFYDLDYRLDVLRGILSGKCMYNKKNSLVMLREGATKSGNGTNIVIHINLLAKTDPMIIIKAIQNRVQNGGTIPHRVYTPVPTLEIRQHADTKFLTDMRFITFGPVPSRPKLSFKNPAYIPECVALEGARARQLHFERLEAVRKYSEEPRTSPSGRRRATIAVDGWSSNDELDATAPSQWNTHVPSAPAHIVIDSDVNEYMRQQRLIQM